MSTPAPDRPQDEGAEATAGEYVLGVLSAVEHTAAARRAQDEPAFAAEVAEWEAKLTPLAILAPEVEPPPGLWAAIAGRIAGRAPVRPAPRAGGFWNSLVLWRGLALASTALAAASVAVLLTPHAPPPPIPSPAPAPVLVARLDAPKGGAVFVATLDQGRRRLIVTPVGPKGPADRSPELWLMPANAKPAPLGVFMGEAALVVAAPTAAGPDSELGVSLEPLGGSPTGAPTGPVIAVGRLMRL